MHTHRVCGLHLRWRPEKRPGNLLLLVVVLVVVVDHFHDLV